MCKECTRSHPHELMDCCCEHKTKIAELENRISHLSECNAELLKLLSAEHWAEHEVGDCPICAAIARGTM